MTLPREVQYAMDAGDAVYGLYSSGFIGHRHWQALRAHLLSQEAELVSAHAAELRLASRAGLAESRLAAANALLRNIAGCQWFNREAPATVELINAHLQGAGDEV